MKRKFTVLIDGVQFKLGEEEKEFLLILCEFGFFRLMSSDDNGDVHYEFRAIDDARSNLLNSSFKSTTSLSSEHLSQVTRNFFSYSQASKDSRFVSHILSQLLCIYHPSFKNQERMLSSGARRAKRACSDKRGGQSPTKKSLAYVDVSNDEILTEGSKEFEELDRNELLSLDVVKENRKSSKKSNDKKLEIDPILELVAKEWSSFSAAKAPWLSHKFTPDVFYVDLVTLKKRIVFDKKPITSEGIQELFAFIRNDEFWKNQALRPKQLLTLSKNGVRKIDNILLSLKRKIEKRKPCANVDLEEAPF